MSIFRSFVSWKLEKTGDNQFTFNQDLRPLATPVGDISFKITEMRTGVYFQRGSGIALFNYVLYNTALGSVIYDTTGKTPTELQLSPEVERSFSLERISTDNINEYGSTNIRFSIYPKNALAVPAQSGGYWGYFVVDGSLSGSLPTVSNVELDSTVIDGDINVKWNASKQNYYEISVTCGGVLKYSYSGNGSVMSHTIPTGRLSEGINVFSVKAGVKLTSDNDKGECLGALSDASTLSTTLTRLKPSIILLEPNGLNQLKSKDITVYWRSLNQTSYSLAITQNGIVKGNSLGTTETNFIILANTLDTGQVDVTLTITYISSWGERLETTKSVSFNAYGAPSAPIWTIADSYTTARPLLSWASTDQAAFQIQIYKNNLLILDSGEVYSVAKTYKFTNALDNNITYMAKIRIKNFYDMYSEWSLKSFTIRFTELQQPTFFITCVDGLGLIRLDISNAEGQNNFARCEVHKRAQGGTWSRYADNLKLNDTFIDCACKSKQLYEYKVRAISLESGFTDSVVQLMSTIVRNAILFDAEDYKKYVVLRYDPNKKTSISRASYIMNFAGQHYGVVEYGEQMKTSESLSFMVEPNELEILKDLYNNSDILLFKDSSGRCEHACFSGGLDWTDTTYKMYQVSFSLERVSFVEGV